MDRLPPVEEQEWLLDCLRMLAWRRGAGLLLEAPMVRARDLGPWAPTAGAVSGMARHLLDQAGLDHLGVQVEAVEGSENARTRPLYHPGTPVWLIALTPSEARFGCEPRALTDRAGAAGLLAHEISHVWRRHQRIEVMPVETEERLVDLTSVYLGFGLLTANLAERARRQRAAWALVAPWSATGVGALPPESLSYLVAAQVMARRMGCLATCGVARNLEPEPRRAFAMALRQLRQLPGGLPWRLRLPGHDRPGRAPRRRSRVGPAVRPTEVTDERLRD